MKRKIISMYILLFMAFVYVTAQDIITVTSNDHEISDNLDLQAVASIFGDSKNLEDFEYRLNDPNTQISNLDLNRDGYVDYLRVVELSEKNTHLIAIQAVIGNDLYQDVATIEVEQDKRGVTTVQVVGDVYMYGPGYIIEPVYVHRPLIVVWYWGPHYRPWCSPYYWAYYPHYFRPWRPYHPHVYRTNVYAHINGHHTYHYTGHRKSMTAFNMHHSVHRNDYGSRHPENSFAKRNKGISNRSQLNQHRKATAANNNNQARRARTLDNKTQKGWKATPERNDRQATLERNDRKATPERNDRKKISRENVRASQKNAIQQKNNRAIRKPSSTVNKQATQKRQISKKQSEQAKRSVKPTNSRTTKSPAATTRNQPAKNKQYAKTPTSRNAERAKPERKTTAKPKNAKRPSQSKQAQKTNNSRIRPGRH